MPIPRFNRDTQIAKKRRKNRRAPQASPQSSLNPNTSSSIDEGDSNSNHDPSGSTQSHSESAKPQSAHSDLFANPTIQLGIWALLAAVVLSYLTLFYTAPIAELSPADGPKTLRMDVNLSLLMDPFAIIDGWVGAPNSKFGVMDRVPILFGVIILVVAGWIVGRAILNRCVGHTVLDKLETSVASIGIGLATLSTVTLCYGLAGLLHQPIVFAVLLAAICGFCIFDLLRVRKTDSQLSSVVDAELPPPDGVSELKSAPFSKLWLLAAGRRALYIVLASMLPPWEYDVREYHLQVPKEWFQNGAIRFLPHNVYGNMPLGTEMHALTAMVMWPGENGWWYGALVGKTVSGSFAILTGLLLFAFGRRVAGNFAGLVACMAYISTPWTTKIATVGYNEVAFGFYAILSLFFLAIQLDQKNNGQKKIESKTNRGNFGLLVGLACAGAISCKYTGLLFVALPVALMQIGLFVLARFDNKPDPVAPRPITQIEFVRWFTWMLAGVAILSGPWFAKNMLFTGNPTYPLLADVFPTVDRTAEQIEQWQNAHRPPANRFTQKHFKNKLTWLVQTGPWISALAVPMLLISLVCFRDRRVQLCWFMVGFGFASWYLMTHQVQRFLFPLYPVVVLVGGVGVALAIAKVSREESGQRLMRLGVWSVVVLISALNLQWCVYRVSGDSRILVSLDDLYVGKPTAKDPGGLMHRQPLFAQLNQAEDVGKVLIVGQAAVFDTEFPILYNTCFDHCRFAKLLEETENSNRLAVLQKENITHLLVDWSELRRLRSTYGYDDFVTEEVVQKMVNTGVMREITTDVEPSSQQLFRIRSDGETE